MKKVNLDKTLKLNTIFLNSMGYSIDIPEEVVAFFDMPVFNQNQVMVGSLTLIEDELKIHIPSGAGTLFCRTKVSAEPEIKYLVIGALGESLEGTFAISTRIMDGDAEKCFTRVAINYKDQMKGWNLDLCKDAYPLKWHFESLDGVSEDLNIDWIGIETKPGITYESKSVLATFHGRDTINRFSSAVINGLEIELTKGFKVNNTEEVTRSLELPIYGSILSQQLLPRLSEDMLKMEPNFHDSFGIINDTLNGWLATLLDLSFPEFSDAEVRAMTGIDRTKAVLQTEDKELTNAYLGKKSKMRVRY